MSAPGFWEIVFLALLALLIFGPRRLPEIARSVGRTVGQLRREASATMDELKRAAEVEEFRDVADDLRSTTAELKRTTDLRGPAGDGAGATVRAVDRASGQTEGHRPAPFDPDAP
jgi:sec-independent protein translocase protein TatB